MGLVQQLLAEKPPNTLYHYTNQTGLLGILRSKKLWATKAQYLNDASEFLHPLELVKEIIARKQESTKTDNAIKLLESLGKALSFILTVHIFVGSVSEVGDLLSQWRGYCPEGNGFSIGFRTQNLQNSLADQGFSLARCVYDKEEKCNLLSELVDDALNPEAIPVSNSFSAQVNPGLAKLSEHLGPVVSKFLFDFLKVGSLLKHNTFFEEKEWRILCGVIPDNNPDFLIRAGKSMLIPYREIKLCDESGFICIDKLIVGPTPHAALATQAARNLVNSLSASTLMIEKKAVQSSSIPYRAW